MPGLEACQEDGGSRAPEYRRRGSTDRIVISRQRNFYAGFGGSSKL